MEKNIKMFIKSKDGKTLEQDVPEGLVEIYREKGWNEVVEVLKPKQEKPVEKSFFNSKKSRK